MRLQHSAHCTRGVLTTVELFQSKFGEDLNTPRKWFEEALEEAQIEDFTWHSLRHTFISRLVMKGAHLMEVKELAGHKTLAMTARYAHLAPGHLADAISLLEKKGKQEARGQGRLTHVP